jgi:diguanylate cyclase (GGDEF)-like protein
MGKNIYMTTKEESSFQSFSSELRTAAWDIVASWLEETEINSACQNLDLSRDPQYLLSELPTLIGGIAKVVDDPVFLMDLEPGGNLYLVAQQFGRLHQETGVQVGKLMADFNLLRRKLWSFLEQNMSVRPDDYFELERRVNLAMDMIVTVAVGVFYYRATTEIIASSTHDKLTGFLQAKTFQERLESETAKAKRYRHPLVLIRADIDNFSAYNETEGRLMGNRLLREVAAGIQSEIRLSDEAGRLDADEFSIILTETDIAGARIAAERLRRRVRQIKRPDNSPVTVSIGGAAIPEGAEESDILMNEADIALKQARRQGGDMVQITDI